MKEKLIELIKYGFWGGITTLINLALFAFLDGLGIMHYVVANGIAYVIAVILNFLCNKFFVFNSPEQTVTDKKESTVQFLKFIGLRAASLAVDSALFYLFVELLEDRLVIDFGFITTRLVIRVVLSTVIIMATFVFSKMFIFKGKNKSEPR